ncbi:MAG: nickel pincer cofactor biosynthesis protein LarB [Thermoplasmata archaeon]|nr:nickel pincer cofactor biosynthesis protein LarB [Thermoplasmata archaeon]MCI4360006.1 nickel pincer cofactor biosynthesis protein LarB [Thermoplasmata archaeon]
MNRSEPRVRGVRSRELRVRDYARYDRDRVRRTGAPEVILAEGKEVDHLLGILSTLHSRGLGALVSRPTPLQLRALRRAAKDGLSLSFRARDRLVVLDGPLGEGGVPGTVAIVTAGTADVPVADEAQALLKAVGVRVVSAHDVGVAGIHRLERALRRLERAAPRAYLVFAGREGALPTVVAGLVRAPVIGVPTSVGYGRGGRGEAALLAMLQSCAPLAVVNVDAGVPAALFALQLLAASHREGTGR